MSRLHTDYLGDVACPGCHGDGWLRAGDGLTRCECLIARLDAARVERVDQDAALTAYQTELAIAREREVALIERLVRQRLAIDRGERPSRVDDTETDAWQEGS